MPAGASAVLAWLRAEPGADVVEGHLGNAGTSVVNVPEHVVDALAAPRLWLVADRIVRQRR